MYTCTHSTFTFLRIKKCRLARLRVQSMTNKWCRVCRRHKGRNRKLCTLCGQRRAYPSCKPERCWIPVSQHTARLLRIIPRPGNHGGMCRDCFENALSKRYGQVPAKIIQDFLYWRGIILDVLLHCPLSCNNSSVCVIIRSGSLKVVVRQVTTEAVAAVHI